METDPILIVSADGHATPPPSAIREYLEPAYRDAFADYLDELEEWQAKMGWNHHTDATLDLIDVHGAIRAGASSPWDMPKRLEEMNREGVAAEVLLAGDLSAPLPFFDGHNRPKAPDLQDAGTRLYHRWTADFMDEGRGRIIGVAIPGTCTDLASTIAELTWCAGRNFKSVGVPGRTADDSLPPLSSPYYEDFWSACDDLDLVLSVHAGHGQRQGELAGFVDRLLEFAGPNASREEIQHIFRSGQVEGSAFAPTFVPVQVFWQLVIGGVFDRHPDLTLALTEVRSDWVPQTLPVLDAQFEKLGLTLEKKPSEYWVSNCMVGASSIKQSEVRLRHQIGVDRLMFGRDYPHREGTWPNTWVWLRDAFAGVPEHEVRQIMGENAVRCYKLDRASLLDIAGRIGPTADQILGANAASDAALVENFSLRAGYSRSFEDVDVDQLVDALSAR